MRDVVITITNVDEEGTVTLSSEQPKVGIALTATLEDPDGVVADSVKWTWHNVAAPTDGTGQRHRDGYVRHLHAEGDRCGRPPCRRRRATQTNMVLDKMRGRNRG